MLNGSALHEAHRGLRSNAESPAPLQEGDRAGRSVGRTGCQAHEMRVADRVKSRIDPYVEYFTLMLASHRIVF